MNHRKPLVSIVMSAYNGEHFIVEAIKSIQNQTFDNWELIIIDDNSTDLTLEIIKAYAKKDHRIVAIHNTVNIGVTKTSVRGTKLSRGEFLARIDSDDVWIDKNKLKKQVEFLQNHPSYGLVGCWAYKIDPDGKRLFRLNYPNTDETIRDYLLIENCFIHSSVVMRKAVLDSVGGYDSKIPVCQDYDLWLKIGLVSKLHNINEYMVNYRVNPNGITAKKYDLQLSETFKIVRRFKTFYPNYEKGIFLWHLRKYVPESVKKFVSNTVISTFITRKGALGIAAN